MCVSKNDENDDPDENNIIQYAIELEKFTNQDDSNGEENSNDTKSNDENLEEETNDNNVSQYEYASVMSDYSYN